MSSKPLKFKAEILNGEGGGAYVEIPFDLEQIWGSKRPKVKATFDGEPYRGTAANMGKGCYAVLARKDVREKIGKSIGDTVKIVLELDTDERVVEVPKELAVALRKNKQAQAAFETAAYTTRKEIARSIAEAKRPETRERRLVQAIEQLDAISKAKKPSR